MTISVADLINNIENGTLADAEQVFNDIMDLKAGQALDAYRQHVASDMFNGPEEDSSDDVEFDEDGVSEQDIEDLGDDQDADL